MYEGTVRQYLGITINYTRNSWLTDQAKTMLRDYYLRPDEDVQEGFARASVAYCGGDLELAQRIYDYVSRGWFMFASPVLSNAPLEGERVKSLPISCFVGDTPILTKSGYKEIKDIKTDDYVLTHKGNYKRVVATRNQESNDLYEVIVTGRATPLVVTGNHLLLTNTGWKRVDELDPLEHLVATNFNQNIEEVPHTITFPEWENTTPGGFGRNTPKDSQVTPELAWALGFWFAEGCVTDAGAIKVTSNKADLCDRWGSAMASHFGVSHRTYKQKSWYNSEVYNKTLAEWFDSNFGRGCKTKTVTDWIVDLPLDHLWEFWNGVYDGDGFKTSKNKAIELSNPQLIAGISNILCKLGVEHSLQLKKKTASGNNGIIHVNSDSYTTRGRRARVPFHDGNIYSRIKSISPLNRTETVYDIEVEDDHSFSAAGVIAHNCFLTYVPDSLEGLIDHTTELRWLSVKGGGVGGHWSDIRGVSDIAPGPVPFLKTVDADMSAYKQGKTRKGSYAAYMDISHPDIEEFINIRIPSGDINRKCLTKGFHNAVNVTDAFMDAVVNGEDWNLVDPNDGTFRDTVSARKLWERILEVRYRTGEPYIHFIDRSNEHMPEYQKLAGLKVRGSNLCSEITLPTDEKRSAVCCLSSVNVEKYDEWKDTDMIGDLVEFLDNVLQFFIENAPDELERARYSAYRERSIGIGMMGWHYYLQSKGIAFESDEAVEENHRVWGRMRAQAALRDAELVKRKGACPDAEEYGVYRRCSNWFAPAPNASSGSLVGTSASIELSPANAYTHRTRAGSHLIKNRHLEDCLEKHGMNTKEVWASIVENEGSVQHLDFLSDHDKMVFKTARETDQTWVIKQAAARQKYICQSQSVNLYFPSGVDRAYFNKVHLEAWKQGLKTLYYVRGTTGAKTEKTSQKVERIALRDFGEDDGDCKACEG